jgi:hypothetical protein
MNTQLKYMPVFRSRQQEFIVLKSFDFGTRIFPCLEIIKEVDRLPPKPRKNAKLPPKLSKHKSFEDVYIPIIASIKSDRIFVDLPVHLKPANNMKPETLDFLQRVVGNRSLRTSYLKKLSSLSSKLIPVISSYFGRSGEKGSIKLQAADLRMEFKSLAFRTFGDSFNRDIAQIEEVSEPSDFLILDLEESEINPEDDDQAAIITRLKNLRCTIIIHRNPISTLVRNVDLVHKKVITEIDNTILERYEEYGGTCFSDYSGIKKDGIGKGGTISPGFLFYDAVENVFYGYKSDIKKLEEFELTIVPAVINSNAAKNMRTHPLQFLNGTNQGWKIIEDISSGGQSGKSPGKFKRIGMEHYLSCILAKINNGDFD